MRGPVLDDHEDALRAVVGLDAEPIDQRIERFDAVLGCAAIGPARSANLGSRGKIHERKFYGRIASSAASARR